MAPPASAVYYGVEWFYFEGWLGNAEYFTGMELVSRSSDWSPSVWRALCMDWQPHVWQISAGTFPEENWHGCIVGGEWLPHNLYDILRHPCDCKPSAFVDRLEDWCYVSGYFTRHSSQLPPTVKSVPLTPTQNLHHLNMVLPPVPEPKSVPCHYAPHTENQKEGYRNYSQPFDVHGERRITCLICRCELNEKNYNRHRMKHGKHKGCRCQICHHFECSVKIVS